MVVFHAKLSWSSSVQGSCVVVLGGFFFGGGGGGEDREGWRVGWRGEMTRGESKELFNIFRICLCVSLSLVPFS